MGEKVEEIAGFFVILNRLLAAESIVGNESERTSFHEIVRIRHNGGEQDCVAISLLIRASVPGSGGELNGTEG